MTYSTLSCDELVSACAESGNADAWQEFVRRFENLIGLVACRVARRYGENSSSVIQDLVQETYARICADNCRRLRNFNSYHQDSFFGMLKVTAANVAHDYFRARNSIKRGSGKVNSELDAPAVFSPDPHSFGPYDIERQILLQEIDRFLISISPDGRDREIFWLHYRQGFTANAIADMGVYGLTSKGIESILHRLRSQVRGWLSDRAASTKTRSGAEGIRKEKAFYKGEEQL